MTKSRIRTQGILLAILIVALPLLVESGHAHADRVDDDDNCQTCQFWSTHQATATPASPEPASWPQPARADFAFDLPSMQDTVHFAHGPRGPPFSS